MKKRETSLAVWTSAAVLAAFAGFLGAQETPAEGAEAAPTEAAASAEAAPEATAEAAPAPEAAPEVPAETASDSGAPELTAAPAAPVKARPSEIRALTAKGLILDVVNTGKHLVAVGDRGAVIVSNNGKDWAQVQTPVRSALTSVAFADDKVGWAVGHDAVILKTSDGGATWAMQNFQPELEKPLLDIAVIDGSTAIAVGAYGLMYKTTDGGTTWAEVDAPAVRGDEFHLNAISKLDGSNYMVVGEQGTIGYSTDSGTTWAKVTSPYEGSLYGAIPADGGGVIIYGLRGNAYQAGDLAAAAAPVEAPAEGAPVDGAVPVDGAAPADAAAAAPTEVAAAEAPADPAAAPVDGATAPADGAAVDPAVEGAAAEQAAAGGGELSPAWTQLQTGTTSSFFGGAKLADGGVALVGLAGMVMKFAPGMTAPQQLKVKVREVDGYGRESDKEITGSYSSVMPWAGGLLLVGELGVQSIKVN